ncbi:MAG: outer membrane protein multidrug efflux system [Verrucomicrobiaceae bacterium]|nr:outer membrane protein multidrug efflux system [Verrucomicrobiaceae bacterium]
MRFLFVLPLILVIPACVVGPNFKSPDDTLPLHWKEAHTHSDQPLPSEWWKLFHSSQLNRLVVQALEGNQDLRGALARVETARALVGVRRADWFPQLGFNSSTGISHTSASVVGANFPKNIGIPLPDLNQESYKASLDMSYELDLWGRVKRSVESAQATARSSDQMLSAQRLTIAAEVARNYFLLRSLDLQQQVVTNTIKLRQEALDLQKSRFDGGMANEMDVTRARTEQELAKADQAALERQRGSTEHALAVLCGQIPSSFTLKADASLPAPPTVPAGLPSTLLQSRPDIAAASSDLEAANADIGVAKAAFFPSFKLTGSGGLDSVEAKDFFQWENRALSIGPSVSLPIFQGGRLKSNLEAAKSRYDEALAKYRQTVLVALREVEDSLLDLQSIAHQRVAIEAAMKAADDTSHLARVRYEKGLASYFEVVEADRTVLTTKLSLAQLDGQRAASSVLLMKALGGGWNR